MKTIKIYLSDEEYNRLKQKAGAGRGKIQDYIRKVCNEPVCFLDSNVRAILKALDLK